MNCFTCGEYLLQLQASIAVSVLSKDLIYCTFTTHIIYSISISSWSTDSIAVDKTASHTAVAHAVREGTPRSTQDVGTGMAVW